VYVYDIVTRSGIGEFRATKYVGSVAISADNSLVAAGEGGYSPAVHVWERQHGRELHVLRGHPYSVWDLSFSPDGERLVSMSLPAVQLFGSLRASGETRIWNLRDGSCERVVPGMADVNAMAGAQSGYVPVCSEAWLSLHSGPTGVECGSWPGMWLHPAMMAKRPLLAVAHGRHLAVLELERF
jgi:WD40 repeat protein